MSQTVSVESGGKKYSATYYVKNDVITVSTFTGSKSTQLAGLEAETLAKLLLGELIREGHAE